MIEHLQAEAADTPIQRVGDRIAEIQRSRGLALDEFETRTDGGGHGIGGFRADFRGRSLRGIGDLRSRRNSVVHARQKPNLACFSPPGAPQVPGHPASRARASETSSGTHPEQRHVRRHLIRDGEVRRIDERVINQP